MMDEESHQAGHIMNEDIRGSGVARGPRGPCPPKLLVNVFSPINLCCYVLLMCKWRLPMSFRQTILKILPPNVI